MDGDFFMLKKTCKLELCFLLILAAVFAWGTALEQQQQALAGEVIRLHVIANSDSEEDQAMKLRVRDAVLAAAEPVVAGAEDAESAGRLLRDRVDELADAANKTLGGKGKAQVRFGRSLFGTRHYDGFSLPGGYYDSLIVTIGAGEGRNWWCVVYPQICTVSAAEEQHAVAVMGGVSEENMNTIQQTTPRYELKFKTLEIFENLLMWFRSRTGGIPTSG